MTGRIGIAIVAISLASATPSWADDCVKYEPAVVTLTGHVVETTVWMFPNFGEDPKHDQRWKRYVFKLDKPVCINGGIGPDQDGFDEDMPSVRAVQLTWKGKKSFDRRLLKKHVVISGTVYHTSTSYNMDIIFVSSEFHQIK